MSNPKKRIVKNSHNTRYSLMADGALLSHLYSKNLQAKLPQLEEAIPIVTKGSIDQRWQVHPAFVEVVRECKRCKAEAVQIRTDGKAVKAICLHCFNIQEV